MVNTFRPDRVICAIMCLALVFVFRGSAKADSSLSETYSRLRPSLALIATFKGKTLLELGTGFCVESSERTSIFATNRHVLTGGDTFMVVRQYPEQHVYKARVVRMGQGATDVAFLLVSEGRIPHVTVDRDAPAEGDRIAIAGYPRTQLMLGLGGLGLTPSVHVGTVNALPAGGFYLQFDAQTEPGNSGGPVFDPGTGDVKGIAVLKLGQRESNLAISTAALVALAANAGVHLTYSDVAESSASGPSNLGLARPTPTPEPTPQLDPTCTAGLAQFYDAYNAWLGSFNRYVNASRSTTSSAQSATNRIGMSGAQIVAAYELKAIRSAIDAEEPKLQNAQNELDGSKASDTARTTNDIVLQVHRVDQDSLMWSNQRYSVLGNLASGGAGFQIDQSLLSDARAAQSAIDDDVSKLKYSNNCYYTDTE